MKLPFNVYLMFLFSFLGACKEDNAKVKVEAAVKPDTSAIQQVLGVALIEPLGRIIPLSSEEKGIIKSIRVNIGDKIKKGDVILTLDNALENAQLLQSQSKTNTQIEVINTANKNLNQLQLKLEKANTDLSRNILLIGKDALTKKELEDSQFAVKDISKQIEIQKSVIQQQQIKLKEFIADLNYLKTVESKKIIRAPSDGTLLSLDAKLGQYLNVAQVIGDFAPDGPLMALTEIDELYADKIKTGQKATIKRQGKNEVITTGTVILTSPYLQKKSLFSDNPSSLEDRRVREVRVKIDEPQKVLIGSRLECVINID